MIRSCLLIFTLAAMLVSCAEATTQNQPVSTAPATGPSPAVVRLVIIGDSTVCNYPAASTTRGWGQYIQECFNADAVEVTNLAASGRSTKTFISEGRWKKALEEHPDYILIQFGHNDSHDPKNPEATDFAGDFKEYLRRYIDEARAAKAEPILVTPMVRRTFDSEGKFSEEQAPPNRPLAAYAQAMREVAKEKNAPLIDLYASSKALAEQLGPKGSAELAAKATDNTHFNEKGAQAMVDLVMKELPVVEEKFKGYLKRS